MDFKIDYGSRPLTPVIQANAPLYASVPGRASALGNNEVVFYDETLERTHVMTLQVLQAMDLCREFKTLDAHVDAIVAAQPALARQQQAVKRVLEGLRSQGLLVSDVTVLDRFQADTSARKAQFAGIFIRACNRPTQLERLLRSLLDYEQRFAARRRYTVIDDSTDAAAVARHAELLAEFAQRSGATVSHVQRAGWDAIVADLADASPMHADAARGMLQRGVAGGGGLGINLSLMLSAGSRLALFDDDFVLPLHRHPAYRAGLVFSRGGASSRTFADVDAAMAAGEPFDGDPFDLHLGLCGESLSTIAAHVDGCSLGVEQLRGMNLSRTPTLRPDPRVLATVNGHRGHSGAASLGWIFMLDAAARAQMPRDAETYQAWIDQPAVWSGSAAFSVSQRGNYTPFAIDNSRLMPCTSPSGRGEDALFASLAQMAYPRDVFMDVPFAIGHLQEGARSRRDSIAQPDRPSVAQCFADLVAPLGDVLVATDPAARLQGAAARLRDLGGADSRALQAYLREFLAHRRSQRIEALQRSYAAAPDAPEPWRADLRAQIEANGKAVSVGGVARLGGWPQDVDADTASAMLRDDANRMADGLDAWPQLWSIARERCASWLDDTRVG